MINNTTMEQELLFDAEEIHEKDISQKFSNNDEVNKEVRIKPVNRQQTMLRVIDVEELIAEDHAARAIWEFVGRLDLSQFYEDIEVVEGGAGRSAFDPQLKISLWIYSYSKGISSAREICRLCEYDPAYQWLTGMEVINYHTLSDFRVKYRHALDELFVQVLGILSAEGLITLERVMHDGTKIKAYAGRDTFRREDRIRQHLKIAQEQVKLMNELQEEEITPRVKKARQRAAIERQARLELALKELEEVRKSKKVIKEKQEARVSKTDPQARIMKQGDGGYTPSYNVQISTDSAEKVILGVYVSQSGNDFNELIHGEEMIERNLECIPDQMVVDGGFISRENIIAIHEKGIDLIGAMPNNAVNFRYQLDKLGIDPAFHTDKFYYDELNDTYTCPAGKILKPSGKDNAVGRTNYRYRADVSDCRACSFNRKCCPTKLVRGRSVSRGVDDPVVSEFITKMETEEAKAIYKQRGPVAEFPNAWIKDKIGLRQFRLQGLLKAGIEALWACITYNIQQWIRLCWRPQFAQASH